MPLDVSVHWRNPAVTFLPSLQGIVDLLLGVDSILQAQKMLHDAAMIVARTNQLTDNVIGGVDALVSRLEAMVLDLLNLDAYVLPVGPVNLRSNMAALTRVDVPNLTDADVALLASIGHGFRISDVVRQVSAATYDVCDPNRPVFSPGAWVGGVVVLFGVDTLIQLQDVIDLMSTVVDGGNGWVSSLRALGDRIAAVNRPSVPPSARAEQCLPPDWTRLRSGLPKSVQDVLQEAMDKVRTFNAAGRTSAMLDEIDDVADQFYSTLSLVIAKLSAVLATLAAASAKLSLVNVYALPIPPIAEVADASGVSLGGGGLGLFLHRLASAGEAPEATYLAGFVVLVGGPTAGAAAGQWTLLSKATLVAPAVL